jgi:hypothetical protein
MSEVAGKVKYPYFCALFRGHYIDSNDPPVWHGESKFMAIVLLRPVATSELDF